MPDTIATDNPFSDNEQRILLALVGAVIPSSVEQGVPGADDAHIAADILATVRPFHATVADALQHIESIATARYDAGYADLDAATRAKLASDLSRSRFAGVGTLVTITVQCYYRDERVMRSLGMEPRPPYPDGFEIPQGDWSLLEPVRQRGKIYKDV